MRFEDNDVCACSTHNPHGPVRCHQDNHSIEIQQCYCVFFDQQLNKTTVGFCYFSCYEEYDTIVEVTTSTELNNGICNQYGSLNRKGRYCGQCNDGYGLEAYSYQYISCVSCQSYGYKNWLRYFAVALLPLTLYYIIAVVFGFTATSSNVTGIVLVTQCMTSSAFMMFIKGGFALDKSEYWNNVSVVGDNFNKIATNLVGMVNLNFFRWTYPPLCLHPKATILEVLALDYMVALYPFFLIFLTYVLVAAYDRKYRLLVWIWKPLQLCTRCYHTTWNIRTSLIETFASFILFSSVKILGVSFFILSFTPVYDIEGKKLGLYLAAFDASVEYFGPQHLPFALLAIIITSILVVLPLLLLTTYPCGCFHRCLNRCGARFVRTR